MGTPEGKAFLELNQAGPPAVTSYYAMLDDKHASFTTLHAASQEVIDLPVLDRHAEELRLFRRQTREALTRENARVTTKCDALRSYMRAHLYRHNAYLQFAHARRLEELKQRALATTARK